jgi:hypothetical protein
MLARRTEGVGARHGLWVLLVLGVGIVSIAMGCQRQKQSESSAASAETGRIAIGSIEPAAGTPLPAGTHVTVIATVDYDLTIKDEGAVFMVIQDERGNSLIPGAGPSVAAQHGRGTAQFRYDLTIPAGIKKVIVYFPLGLRAGRVGTTTSTVAMQEYAVVQRP